MSGIPLRLTNGVWQPYQPPKDHPGARKFKKLWGAKMSMEYATQKQELDEENVRQNKDVFVASCMCLTHPDSDESITVSVWSDET